MAKEKAGAAWVKTLKEGKKVVSITIGDKRYSMWKNDYKTEDKHPDYVIYADDYVAQPQAPIEKTVASAADMKTDLGKKGAPALPEVDNSLPF